MIDPIESITNITGAVLRRIADAIDTSPAAGPTVTIHIRTLHVHSTPSDLGTTINTELKVRGGRTRFLGRQ